MDTPEFEIRFYTGVNLQPPWVPVSKTQRAAHLPFMGEKGMDVLMELKEEFLDRFED